MVLKSRVLLRLHRSKKFSENRNMPKTCLKLLTNQQQGFRG